MGEVEFRVNFASSEQLVSHFQGCDQKFLSSLSRRVDVRQYAAKIVANAERFEAWADDQLVGLVAAYINDLDKHSAFATSVSVMPTWNRKGIASELLNRCITHVREVGFSRIILEVESTNNAAAMLYKKHGFIIQSEHSGMMKMALFISERK